MSDRDPMNLTPALRETCAKLEAIMELAGHPMFLTDGLRTNEEQDALYAQGRTQPGPVVTNAKAGQSDHNPGPDGLASAADYAFDDAEPWAEKHPWDFYGAVARVLGLSWGGDWSTPDRPHIYVPKALRT